MSERLVKHILPICLALMLLAIPVIGTGCEEKEETPATTPTAIDLASTMVPNTELDIYIYIQHSAVERYYEVFISN